MKIKFINENFVSLQLKYWISALVFGVIFPIGLVNNLNAENGYAIGLMKEAQTLIYKEDQFYNARLTSNWEKIHSLQHPEFKKKVSVGEMQYFEGWVAHDYRDEATKKTHISGSAIPSLDYIKKHPKKFDFLGFPVVRKYLFSNDPYLKLKKYSLERILISKNGKYAKVKIMAKGKQKINPVFARGNFEFDAQYPLTDYWEKVDGKWVVTLLSTPVSSSGSGILKYFLPNNNKAWQKMDFYEINLEGLKIS